MELRDIFKGFGDAFHKVQGDTQAANTANEQATATGSATLQVGDEQYKVEDKNGAGRTAAPIPQNNPPTTTTS